jgi:hypothetical protein
MQYRLILFLQLPTPREQSIIFVRSEWDTMSRERRERKGSFVGSEWDTMSRERRERKGSFVGSEWDTMSTRTHSL